MKKLIKFKAGTTVKLISILMLTISFQSYGVCNLDSQILSASFNVTSVTKKGKKEQQTINLWRMGEQVAYEYVEQGVTELWQHISNGQIRPVRYFDRYKRGIEYQPLAVNYTSGNGSWSSKKKILDDNYIKRLVMIDADGEGCKETVYYENLSNDKQSFIHQKINVSWLTHFELPKNISIKKDNRTLVWELTKIIEANTEVLAFFKKLESYQ